MHVATVETCMPEARLYGVVANKYNYTQRSEWFSLSKQRKVLVVKYFYSTWQSHTLKLDVDIDGIIV